MARDELGEAIEREIVAGQAAEAPHYLAAGRALNEARTHFRRVEGWRRWYERQGFRMPLDEAEYWMARAAWTDHHQAQQRPVPED